MFAWQAIDAQTTIAAPKPAPAMTKAGPARPRNDSFKPRARHLIYVALPGSLETPAYRNGLGVVVLDAGNDNLFVKRIPTWDTPASMSPEQMRALRRNPVTNMMYVAARGRLGAWDLATDKMVVGQHLRRDVLRTAAVTRTANIWSSGSDLKDFWYVIDPRTASCLHKLQAPLSPNSHNLNLSPDGKTAFMSPNNPVMTISDVATGKLIKNITFGDHIRVFVLNHDATKSIPTPTIWTASRLPTSRRARSRITLKSLATGRRNGTPRRSPRSRTGARATALPWSTTRRKSGSRTASTT